MYDQKKNINKLRIYAHPLNIEGGRYTFTGLPPEVRKCSQYSMKEIEDEQHFWNICPKYNKEWLQWKETIWKITEIFFGDTCWETNTDFELLKIEKKLLTW